MDFEAKRFGRGHKELGGAHDLISQYKLWPYYEFFCKRSHPASIAETHYLHNVVGDTKIRKGEGMELDQLCRNASTSEKETCLHPFGLDVLSEAFHMKEMSPVRLSSTQKGLVTPVPKSEKNRKDKDKDRKGEKHTRHKPHQVKDGSCIENNRICPKYSHPMQLKVQQDKVSSHWRQSYPSREHPQVCGANSPNGHFFHPQGSNLRPCLRGIKHVPLKPTLVG
ncbi:unnamed protein product [Lupinus luteus]|uniref:Mediator of RNA polymerase II transcription subunit 19b n=1 Tax=Lupinus luteus TaxID=3873 RepID=A0AAV1Y9S5_LUPLU